MTNPEDVAGGSWTPRDVERRLIVEWIPKENLSLGTCVFDLTGTLALYKSDWKEVSHAFDVQEDGSALLTYILERGTIQDCFEPQLSRDADQGAL